jgi:hypothetical protein
MTISRWILLRLRIVLDKRCRQKKKTHFMFNNFFRKSCPLWDNVEKYGGTRGATNDVTIWRIRVACWLSRTACTHKPTRLGMRAHTHTLTQICNIYCFSKATVFRERASVYVILHRLSCFNVGKIKFSPEQAMRVQRGRRWITLFFL